MIFLLSLRQTYYDIFYSSKHSLRSRSSREIVTAFFSFFEWQKKLRHLNFGETFMFVGCAVRKIFKTKFIMDFAKVTKISLHLQLQTTTKNILIWKTSEWCRGLPQYSAF